MQTLVIANKLYSSWSMRPWLVLHAFKIPFGEVVIPLRLEDSKVKLSQYSPSGKVPVLIDDGVVIWESLSIIEYLAENNPDLGIWPRNRALRAHARSISNEMHGGFMPLRQGCPMNLGAKFKTPELTESLVASAARVEAIWSQTRAQYGKAGAYLYGDFTAADAMYAPVVTRLDTYQIPVQPATRAYMDTILAHPSVVAWKEAALEEPWVIKDYEAGHTAVETYR
jgi:glutathione S-transferase